MNRDEILKAVQLEKQEMGEYEQTVVRKALMYASAFGVVLWSIMLAMEILVFKKIDFGKPAILFAISGFSKLYEGKKIYEKKKIRGGLIEIFVAIIWVLLYIGAFFV